MDISTHEVKPSVEQKTLFYNTIEKLKKHQKLKSQLIPYLENNHPSLLKNNARKERIQECCNIVSFKRYLETGDIQLSSSTFCKYDRICIACATKRAMRMIKRFATGIKENGLWTKKRYYIVLTIKHSKDDTLEDLLNRLMQYKDRLARNYRNSKRPNQKKKSFFAQFDGMVTSIEVSHKGNNGWHPHINILACSDQLISIETWKHIRWSTSPQLLEERKEISEWSYIHNIRQINVTTDHFNRNGIGEVFKYAIKFSDLTIEQLAYVMVVQDKYHYRFFATYGCFRKRNLQDHRYNGLHWKEWIGLYAEWGYWFKNT